MKPFYSSLVGALALLLSPSTALSLDLFEGNLGSGGNWLYVFDAPTMSGRVYWYDLGVEFTYQAQFAADNAFSQVVLDVGDIDTNYVEPGLGPGFYHFRVREIDSSGIAGSWSNTGTLEVLQDFELPQAGILFPLAGQTFVRGDTLAIELEVSDDTVLRMARFTINGEYAGVLGLSSENYKLKPSLGEPRTVVFNYPIPTKGKGGALEISVAVSDVTYKTVTRTVVVDTVKDGDGGGGGGGKGGKKR